MPAGWQQKASLLSLTLGYLVPPTGEGVLCVSMCLFSVDTFSPQTGGLCVGCFPTNNPQGKSLYALLSFLCRDIFAGHFLSWHIELPCFFCLNDFIAWLKMTKCVEVLDWGCLWHGDSQKDGFTLRETLRRVWVLGIQGRGLGACRVKPQWKLIKSFYLYRCFKNKKIRRNPPKEKRKEEMDKWDNLQSKAIEQFNKL